MKKISVAQIAIRKDAIRKTAVKKLCTGKITVLEYAIFKFAIVNDLQADIHTIKYFTKVLALIGDIHRNPLLFYYLA